MNRLTPDRRHFLGASAIAATGLATGNLFANGRFAEELVQTPVVAEGPFYPDELPLDTDNDLLLINDSITPAIGEITYLTGRVLGANGTPVRNAFVEIWQCDANGAYIHSGSSNKEDADENFQGYGRFLTDSTGQYFFRTIKPVSYPGRTPHIHFGVSRNGHRVFTTQMLIKDHPSNERDGLFRQIREQELRDSICADFTPLENSTTGELTANFDIVLGRTAEELEDGTIRGGIGPSLESQRRR